MQLARFSATIPGKHYRTVPAEENMLFSPNYAKNYAKPQSAEAYWSHLNGIILHLPLHGTWEFLWWDTGWYVSGCLGVDTKVNGNSCFMAVVILHKPTIFFFSCPSRIRPNSIRLQFKPGQVQSEFIRRSASSPRQNPVHLRLHGRSICAPWEREFVETRKIRNHIESKRAIKVTVLSLWYHPC